MSRFSMLALLAVALAIPTLICWSNYSLSAQGKDAPPNALKWEYKKVYEVRFEKNQPVSIGERELNDLGIEGWELCGVVGKTRGSVSGGGQLGIRGDTTTDTYFVFKRPKR